MSEKKRVLICEFHQESDTFNPIVMELEDFEKFHVLEGKAGYDLYKNQRGAVSGIIDGIEKSGGEVIPSVFLYH